MQNRRIDYGPPVTHLTRTYRMAHRFRNSKPQKLKQLPPFKRQSTYEPPKATKEVEDYLSTIQNKLDAIPKKQRIPNLGRADKSALKSLAMDTTRVVKKADKGSKIVVEDKDNYVSDGLAHLADREIYEKVDEGDPTPQLALAINAYIKVVHNKGYISDGMKEYLTFTEPENTRTQQLYFIKKLHKGPHQVRPIVSGCSGPTEKLSCFLDYFLQPRVPKTASYLKDSRHLLQLLENNTFDQDIIIATIDVKSLYLCIPHDQGITSSVSALYEDDEGDLVPFPPNVAKEMMGIILKRNFFEFDSDIYRQVRGTAMGTRMAPAYANLFMDSLERKFLEEEETKPLMWRRFIDDILCIWPGSSESLERMLTRLNNAHQTIKFTWDISQEGATFLDLELSKGERFRRTGMLDVAPHFKPTNAFQYLHYKSAHPRAVHRGIVKGELTRILRACSSEVTFTKCKLKMLEHFRNRGYPRAVTEEIGRTVSFTNRHRLLEDTEEEEDEEPETMPPLIIMPYDPYKDNKEVREAIKPPEGKDITVPMICYTKNKDLARNLVRARLPHTQKPLSNPTPVLITHSPTFKSCSTPCSKPLCRCCALMSKRQTVFSSSNSKAYHTPVNTNCDTQNVVYLIQCSRCSSRNQYIGQTARPLRNRMAGHRAAYSLNIRRTPLYTHLRRPEHSFDDIRLTVLERVEGGQRELLQREKNWMERMDTMLPKGLNLREETIK